MKADLVPRQPLPLYGDTYCYRNFGMCGYVIDPKYVRVAPSLHQLKISVTAQSTRIVLRGRV